MRVLRTPDERFANLPGFSFDPHYVEIPDGEDGLLRIHHVDEGKRGAEPMLLMHGEPTWSYLYRKMIPIFTEAGYRSVAPDLPGFGRSDKPADRKDYTYSRFVDWMQAWLDETDLNGITLVCQDWGGLIGLRLVAANPERFARVVVANTGLPTGEGQATEAFMRWCRFSQQAPEFRVGEIIAGAVGEALPPEVLAAYDAPFPDETFKEGARLFPSLVPISSTDLGAAENREAWKVLSRFDKPLVTMFSDEDPVTRGGEKVFQKRVPGAQGQPHTVIRGGSHFLQENRGEEFARAIVDFLFRTPVAKQEK